jgi:prophage tail gpP-like protein
MAQPQYVSDELGTPSDSIALVLNGDRLLNAIGWEYTEGILSQPCSWTIQAGSGDIARKLLKLYPKHTSFQLYIGTVLQATGRTDAPMADQTDGGATVVSFKGRDSLAPLHDTYVKAQVGVNVTTYADLVRFALKKCGIDPSLLVTDNSANRRIKSGVPITAILPHRTVEQILEDAGTGTAPQNAGVVHTQPLAKLNETWHQFVRRYLDRAGLMLWAGATGNFILGAPNASQPATYYLTRNVGTPNQGANVTGCSFQDDATHRHTEAIVYGRGGGKIVGRTKAKGSFVDQEMIDAGYGDQPIVYRDVHVHSSAEASYFARRKLAEERRSGWRLEYRIAGLTLPYAGDGGRSRAVITPDTVVNVRDEELGLIDNFYVETVIRRRSPQTTTTIRLMRLDDLVFGGPEADGQS